MIAEQQMAQLHRSLYNKGTETVFLMADARYAFISSTMAKQVISLGGAGDNLVPPCVLKKNEREIITSNGRYDESLKTARGIGRYR